MAILFAVVARGTTILAKHAWCGGNFLEVTEQILAKIPSENNKLTYSHGNYLFHYICQDRIIYLCITDDDFERSRAFSFLNEIKKRFQTTYGSRAQTALPYAMNSEFSSVLAAQLKYHSESKGTDQVAETQAQVDELKGIMVRNIDLVAQRGEKLELLIDKTENLVDSSVTFKTTSRNLARAMCMKNLKLTIIIIIVSIVSLIPFAIMVYLQPLMNVNSTNTRMVITGYHLYHRIGCLRWACVAELRAEVTGDSWCWAVGDENHGSVKKQPTE
ncbi:hypothetical protein ASZ78_016867 [Callipepla squamata]|uniref:Vesicle-associated membrane protein 7 n=2 Tax=Galliformes TaxID=8976 RepID=A0A226MTQ5_CALSU|nr:hypothetical protein ASZ78_016867 [Callipepla squamata]